MQPESYKKENTSFTLYSGCISFFVLVQGACLNLGERMDLSPDYAKMMLRKRSIHPYVRLPKYFFRARWTKDTLSVHQT